MQTFPLYIIINTCCITLKTNVLFLIHLHVHITKTLIFLVPEVTLACVTVPHVRRKHVHTCFQKIYCLRVFQTGQKFYRLVKISTELYTNSVSNVEENIPEKYLSINYCRRR